jgi:hypothetical protein
LTGVGAVTNYARAMGQELRKGYCSDRGMETAYITTNWIVKAEFARFAQLEDGCSRETLRMRSDAESMTRCQAFALDGVGVSIGSLKDDAFFVSNGNNTTGLAGQTYLEVKPVTDILKRVL